MAAVLRRRGGRVTAHRIRRIAPGEAALFDAMLDLFGTVFAEPATYGARRPSPAYRDRLLDQDGFVALVAVAQGAVVGALAAYELAKFEQERSGYYI